MEMLVVNGRSYGRSPSHGCKFVDKSGHLLPGQYRIGADPGR